MTVDEVLVVVDAGDDQVEIRDKDLAVVVAVGSTGAGDDQFDGPTRCALDRHFARVVDYGNLRVHTRAWEDLVLHRLFDSDDLGIPASEMVNTLAVDHMNMLLGRVDSQAVLHKRRKTWPYENFDGWPVDCGAGQIVGVAVMLDIVFVANKTGNAVERRDINDGSLTHSYSPAGGYTVEDICTDGTAVYVLVSHATDPFRVIVLDVADLTATGVTYDHSAGYTQPIAIACDATYLFVTEATQHALVRVKVSDWTSIEATDLTAPAGVACLPPHYDDLPWESRRIEVESSFGSEPVAPLATQLTRIHAESTVGFAGQLSMIATGVIALVQSTVGFLSSVVVRLGARHVVQSVVGFVSVVVRLGARHVVQSVVGFVSSVLLPETRLHKVTSTVGFASSVEFDVSPGNIGFTAFTDDTDSIAEAEWTDDA